MKSQSVLVVIFIFIVSTVLLFSLFQKGIYNSHDGEVHVARIAQFRQALEDGQLPVRWLGNWNFGYGYPALVYAYSLPYYIGTLLKQLNLSYEEIYKVLIFSSLFFSGLTFYYFSRNYFPKTASIIGSLFYISAPYRLADIYERGALAECLSFIFLPLLFLVVKFLKKEYFGGFLVTSLIVFAVLTTHALTLLVFLPFLLLFWILEIKKDRVLAAKLLFALLFGVLLSAFQILPMIFEQKYVELDKTYFNIFQGTFISINQLLRIPKEGVNIGTGIQLGLAQSSVILLSLVLAGYEFLARRSFDKFTIFFLITSLVAALLTLDISKSVWLTFKPLTTVLFPWRFLTLTTFSAAILASLLTNRFVNSIYSFIIMLILIFIALYPSRHYWKGQGWHTFENNYYQSYPDPLKLDNYYLPKGLRANLQELQLEPVSAVDGDGVVSLLKKQSNLITTQISSTHASKIQFHTMYFPGWTLSIDNKQSFSANKKTEKTEIIKDYPNLEGIIVAQVPKGNHIVTLEFMETPLRRAANLLSLFGFMVLVAIVLARNYLAQFSRKVKQVL